MLHQTDTILAIARALVSKWQEALGADVKLILGGSLASGLFVYDDTTKVIDVDVRFIVADEQVTDLVMRARIEQVTGLKYKKTIKVEDEPMGGFSDAVMIEGHISVPEVAIPLEVEGCLRNRRYFSSAHLYPRVYSAKELSEILACKAKLKAGGDLAAYKAYKRKVRLEADKRIEALGLESERISA